MDGTDMQNNAFVVSKARCNMVKVLLKRRKTLNMSKAYRVAILGLVILIINQDRYLCGGGGGGGM
jgi:ribulose 1,5-bisphosphate synthetase/thiazole synthase